MPNIDRIKDSVNLLKQNDDSWFRYHAGSDTLTLNPRIMQVLVALEALCIDFDITQSSTTKEGRVCWDPDEDSAVIGMPGGNVNLNIGMENFLPRRVSNKTGEDLKNGQLVYISGGTGINALISLAKADAHTTAENTIAMLTEDIDDDSKGYATTFGLVRGSEAQPIDTSAYTAGDKFYLSPDTAGAFTGTLPVHPNYVVSAGQVFRSHATEGIVIVRIESPVCACKIAGGDSAVWIDENFSAIRTALGAQAPDFINYSDTNILVAALDGNATTEELHSWREFQHDGLEGSSLKPHLHIGPVDDSTGDVKIFLEYNIFGDGTEKASGTSSVVSSAIADGTAWTDHFLPLPDIDCTDMEIGDQIGLRLYRDPSDSSDTYTSDIYIKTWGYHYQVDSLGSRNTGSKG